MSSASPPSEAAIGLARDLVRRFDSLHYAHLDVETLAKGLGTSGDRLICDLPDVRVIESAVKDDPATGVPFDLAVAATYCPARYAQIEQDLKTFPPTSSLPWSDYDNDLAPGR